MTPLQRAAVIGLVTWAAFAAAYYALLHGRFGAAPLVAIAAGFFMAVVIGSYRIAAAKFADAMRISGRQAPVDGQIAGITGTLRTSQPIDSPFTKRPSSLYVYSIEHDARGRDVSGMKSAIKDYSGLALATSEVDSPFGSFRIGSFPTLEGFDRIADDSESLHDAAASYIASTAFEDLTGLKVGETFAAVSEMVSGGQDFIRKDWQLTDKGLSANSRVVEQAIEPGTTVCLIGRYSAAEQAIVTADGVAPQLVRGGSEEAMKALIRTGAMNAIVATIIALALNAAVAMPFVFRPNRAQSASGRKAHSFEEIYRYHDAIRHGDLQAARLIASNGMPINIASSDGVTPLAIAGNDDIASWLIAGGADVNAVDGNGETVLMQQAELGHAGIVKMLIAKGVKLDAIDPRYQMTALEVAEQNEHLDVAQVLRDAGAADKRVTERNGTRLHDGDPPVRACLAYLDALFANDRKGVQSFWIADKQQAIAGADLETYRGARPHPAQLVDGFANESAATLELRGPMPGGTRVTWRYDLVKINGEWKLRDETWETRFNDSGK